MDWTLETLVRALGHSAGSTLPHLLADRFVLEVALIDYGPVLLRIPFGSRLAADTLSSEARRAVASGPPWLSPAFAFVPV